MSKPAAVATRVRQAVSLLDSLNPQREVSDTMAGARGRVLGARTGLHLAVEIVGVLAINTLLGGSRYTLEFTMVVRPDATALDIMKAATQIAELHADAPRFGVDELQAVYDALDALLGTKS